MNDFEERLRRLEEIAEALRDGNTPLHDAAALFEEGMKLSRRLDGELREMEKRIEILTTDPEDENAPPEFDEFDRGEGDAGAGELHGTDEG